MTNSNQPEQASGHVADVEVMLAVASKAWNEHQANCRIATVSGSLHKVVEAIAALSAPPAGDAPVQWCPKCEAAIGDYPCCPPEPGKVEVTDAMVDRALVAFWGNYWNADTEIGADRREDMQRTLQAALAAATGDGS